MKIERSISKKIKFEALRWLRVDRRCMFIATEAGAYSSDVLGINEERMIEIEIKTSFDDFKNDFKKYKHDLYLKRYSSTPESQWIPTHFYFAVTSEILDQVKEFIMNPLKLEKHPGLKNYGLICLEGWRVEKSAKWIHKRAPSNRVKCAVALRMGSELIRFHEAWL